jgi:S1-C subfamily serine protease
MKKLLGIIVLGLLLSGNAYAKSKTTTIDQNKLIKANKIYVGMSLTEFKKVNGKFQKESTIYSENWDYQIKLNSNGSLDQSQNLFLFKNNSGKGYATSMTGWPGFQKIAKKIILISIHNKTDIIQNWIDAKDILLKDGGTDIWKKADILYSFKEAEQLVLIKDIKDKHTAKKPKDNSIISKDSIPNIKNSEWKTSQNIDAPKNKKMFFFGDGSCKFFDTSTKCEWTQNKNILTFIIADQAIYKVNLNGEKWSGTAHNSKIDRSWKSFGEAVFVEDWIKISYVPKDEKPKNESEENSLISGTAFFIDNNGHMITNHHVIEDCKDKSQITYNNENIKAKLIAKDEFLDLALLKADVKNSNFINISTAPPKKLKRVIVAGYPFGLELSNDLKFNSGIITSLKGLGDDSTRIQIDAAINPGNSGGPIVYEENGELAAVAVAGLSKDKTEAVNFGIKASSVENFLQSNQIDLTLVEQKFNFSNDDLAELLESSTLYTFCK